MKQHSKKSKMIALMLTLCLVITLIPDIGYATEDADSVTENVQTESVELPVQEAAPESQDENEEMPETVAESMPDNVVEVTATTTTYDLGDGEQEKVIHGGPVRFEDENEELIDYDPSLVEIIDEETDQEVSLDGYAYTNLAGDMKHYIPEELSENIPVRMEYKDHAIEFSLVDETLQDMEVAGETASVEEKQIQTPYSDEALLPVDAVYGDGKDAVEVKYTSMTDTVKETLVLNERPESNVFTYKLKLTGMTARKNVIDEGITYYDDETGEITGFMSAPWMNDATGDAYSEDITYELEEVADSEGEYIVTMTLDQEYLDDEEIQYPVTVDPSNTWQGNSEFRDVYVISGSTYKNTNFYESGTKKMPVGVNSTGTHRTYIHLISLKGVTGGHSVSSAKLTVYETGTGASGQKIGMYRITEDWSSSSLTWSNKPTNASGYVDTITTSRTAGTAKTFDITSFVRKVADGDVTNYGVVMRNITSDPGYACFYGSRASSYKPKLVVTYYDKPTAATSLSTSRSSGSATSHFKTKETVYATWSGMTAYDFSAVQYKITGSPSPTAIGSNEVDLTSYRSIGSATASATKKSVAYTSSLPAGTYTLYIRAKDAAGNYSSAKSTKFYVDGTDPSLTKVKTTPAADTTSKYTNELTPTVSWKATDTYFSKVTVKVDDEPAKDATTTSGDGTYEIKSDTIKTSGKHTITVKAYDKAGNVSSETIAYYVDIDEPDILSFTVSPDTSEGGMASDRTPTVSWNISDDSLSDVSIFVDDVEIDENILTSTSGSYTFSEELFGESKDYEIRLTATDSVGNVSEETLVYSLDLKNPVLSAVNISPKTNAIKPSGNCSPKIRWEVSDNNFSSISYSLDGENYTVMGETAIGSFVMPSDIWNGAGTYTIYVKAQDKAGNESVVRELTYHLTEGTDFLPQNIRAKEYYGKRLIMWDIDAYDSEKVAYDIHRSTQASFTPSESTLVEADIDAGEEIYTDKELLDAGTYYYKLVIRDISGEGTADRISGEVSVYSGTTVNDLKNTSGYKDYLSYTSFETPVGTGNIEESSGNLSYEQTDFSVENTQLDYSMTRTYNSQINFSSMIGKGWIDSYHKELFTADDDIYFVDSDGSCYVFKNTDGEYSCNETKDLELTENAIGYKIETKDDITYKFNEHGQLVETAEPNGCKIINTYDDIGRLVAVTSSTDSVTKEISSFEYHTDEYLLKKVKDFADTEYSYNFDDQMLESVDVKGAVSGEVSYRYGYDDGYLTDIYDGEGHCYQTEYDNGKVTSAIYPDGEKHLFVYSEGQTVMTRLTPEGTAVYTENTEFDSVTGRIESHTDPAGNVTSYEYMEERPYLISKVKSIKSYQTIENGKVVFNEKESVTETEYSYDENDNVISEVDSNGAVTTYAYDKMDNLESEVTVDSGKTVSDLDYSYDDNGNLINETDNVLETSVTYGYDGAGNEISVTEKEEGVTISESINTYDSEGNLIAETSIAGTIANNTENQYDAMGRVIYTEENGTETYTEYDFLGRAVKETTKESGKDDIIKEYLYNKNGSLIYETDTSSVNKCYGYDSRNRNIREKTYASDIEERITTTEYGFDYNINVKKGVSERTEEVAYTQTYRDTAGNVTSKDYIDVSGNTIKTETADSFTDYTYDKSGNQIVTYVGNADNNTCTIDLALYDERGNNFANISKPGISNGNYVIISENGDDDTIVTYTEHNVTGTVSYQQDGEGNTTSYTYTPQNELESCIITGSSETAAAVASEDTPGVGDDSEQPGPNGAMSYADDLKITYVRQSDGSQIVTYTDARKNSRTETTNAAGLVTQTKDIGGTDEILYTDYSYDTQGRKELESYSDGSYISYTYEGDSARISTRTAIKADGSTESIARYSYYDDGMLKEVIYEDSEENEHCKTEYIYDSEGKLRSESVTYSDGKTQKTEYTYDAEGRIKEKQYPSDSELGKVTYAYDAAGNPVSISQNDKILREYTYDPMGRTSQIRLYDSAGSDSYITENYSYDDFGRVSSIIYKDGNEILESFSYEYDLNNYISKLQHVNDLPADDKKIYETREYSYDKYGNLTVSSITDHTNKDTQTETSYVYDEVGNRKSMTTDGVTTGYEYNGLNQLTEMTSGGKTISYTYDGRGNQILEENDTHTQSVAMEYAVTGEMTSLIKSENGSNTLTQTNVYNQDGIRISRTENSDTRSYYYDQGTVSFMIDNGNTSNANILNASGAAVGTYRGDNYYSYFKDQQGSTSSIIDPEGSLIASYDYSDFGETTEITGATFDNQICYTGGIYDEDTEIYYLNARYYNPEIGRFISQDTYRGTPEDSNQWHLYVYCASNPINYVDPSGHWVYSIGVEGQASAAIGVYAGYMLNIDSNGYANVAASTGLLLTSNVVANMGVFIAGYSKYNSVDCLNGFGASIGVAFSCGAKVSASGSLGIDINGKMSRNGCVSYGAGVSLAPIPYFEVKAGYTSGSKKFKLKKLFNLKKGKSQKYNKGGMKITIKRNSKSVIVSSNKTKRKIYIYPTTNKKKVKKVKVKK